MNYLLFKQLFTVLTKSDSKRLSILLKGTTVGIQNNYCRLLTTALTMNLLFATDGMRSKFVFGMLQYELKTVHLIFYDGGIFVIFIKLIIK
jgi:hypothetical protein